MMKKFLILLFICGLFQAHNVQAGTSCEAIQITPELIETGFKLSIQLLDKLNELKPEVAIIARVGSDSSKYGIKYTHLGFLIKSDSNWEIVHLLNSCGTNSSSIYAQGLLNFYIDDLFTNETLLAIPDATLQEKISKTIKSRSMLTLHNKNYNMIAYPFATKYQNSNQWILEVMAHSHNPELKDRKSIQHYLKSTGYQPHIINLSSFEKIGAGFKSNIAFDDHTGSEQRSNSFSVVTVNSVVDWMKKNRLLHQELEF